jgi:hypothetical protein
VNEIKKLCEEYLDEKIDAETFGHRLANAIRIWELHVEVAYCLQEYLR